MNWKFETRSSSETDPRRKKFVTILARDTVDKLNSILDEDPDHELGPALYNESLTPISDKLKELRPEYSEEIEGIISAICNTDFSDTEAFGNQAAESLAQFILRHFDYSQIEEISRRGRNMLNRLVEYEIDYEEEVIWLHIPMTLLENGVELRTLFIEALGKLAEKLNQDPDLREIKKICAASWIIYRIPDKHLETLGFSNIERYEKDKSGSAEISREVLLEKYGQV